MSVLARRTGSFLFIIALGLALNAPCVRAAENHVVSIPQLRQAVNLQAQSRQAKVAKIDEFFSTPRVEKTLKAAQIDPVQVRNAVPQLSDAELARLAARTDKLQRDFAAGSLTNQQITYILIAIGTALLITIIFVAK